MSTNGTLLWEADVTYHNDITGIGREDTEGFYQKQSKSKDDSLLLYIDVLKANNTTNSGIITHDKSCLIIGHNKGLLRSTPSSINEKPSGIRSRFEREWKVTNSNFKDSYSLEIEWENLGIFNINDIRLLVDTDGDFFRGHNI